MSISKEYIRHELERLTAPDRINEHTQHLNIPVLTADDILKQGVSSRWAEDTLRRGQGAFGQSVIHFLFANKEFLKKLPLLGGLLVSVKDKLLRRELQKTMQPAGIDLSDCIGWYTDDFINECYWRLLGRPADESGKAAYQQLVRQGADNRVIAFALAQSAEFGQRAPVENLLEYKKVYKSFFRKLHIKKIPILGRIAAALATPNQIMRLYNRLERTELLLNSALEQLGQQAAAQSWQTQHVLEQLVEAENKHSLELVQQQNEIGQFLAAIQIEHRAFAQQQKLVRQTLEDLTQRQNNTEQWQIMIQQNLVDMQARQNQIAERQTEAINIATILSEKMDSSMQIATGLSEKMDSAMQISSALADKMDTVLNISTALSEKADTNVQIATINSQKLDALPEFIAKKAVLSSTSVLGMPGGVIGIVCGDFILGVPSEEWGFAMFLSQVGYFEPGSEQFFEKMLNPNMTVIDLGANLGIYTLRALRKGCQVYAYEPTPKTFELLKQNIKVNGFAESGRACARQLAVADNCGIMNFYANPLMCGHNSFYQEGNEEKISVQSVTLDSQREIFGNVDIIKMDIEGAEYFAWLGMRKLLQENPEVQIVMEFAPVHMQRAGVQPEQMLALIREDGFGIKKINEETAEAEYVSDEDLLQAESVNIYLTRDKK